MTVVPGGPLEGLREIESAAGAGEASTAIHATAPRRPAARAAPARARTLVADPMAEGCHSRRGGPTGTVRRVMFPRVAAVLAAGAAVWTLAPSSSAASGVSFRATIGGRDVATANTNDALALHPGRSPHVSVRVTNEGSSAITIREVRLDGRVIGLTFFSYQTSVSVRVPAGATRQFGYDLDLVGLRGQAVGLIPGTVSLRDRNGTNLASRSLTVDVRGSIISVYGLFGLSVLLFTAFTLAAALILLARNRLPPNRALRALRFAVPGLGLGLTLTVAVSALRLIAPRPVLWLPLVLGFGGAGFVVGYLTPTPEGAADEDEDEDEDEEEAGAATVAGSASGAAPPTAGPGAST